jgi:hypothetical protein
MDCQSNCGYHSSVSVPRLKQISASPFQTHSHNDLEEEEEIKQKWEIITSYTRI